VIVSIPLPLVRKERKNDMDMAIISSE